MRAHSIVLLTMTTAAAACGGRAEGPPGAAGPAAFPPTEVQTTTIAPKPLPRTSEYLATIRSLRSTTIQPQVDGMVTQIFVRSGQRVRVGQPLIQIDPDKQQAAVHSLESARAAREADVVFTRQQVARMRTLLEAGAVSRQELEQAEAANTAAEAQLAAIEAQIRESRVELQYYRVAAPTAGVVGDVPVRVGDRVNTSSVITTIDQLQGLEAYIAVPLEQAPDLKLGLPVELLDANGRVIARNPITFVADRADDGTQTVLVKSRLRDPPESIRVLQYVRARIVWSLAERTAVPIVSVIRVGGAHFVFVAEGAQQGFVARQKPVQLGEVIGNDYIVRSGLEAGDRLIVSGIQKLRDGAPVKPVGGGQ